MDKFQLGDKIRVVNDHETWLDRGQANGSIFTAVDDNGNDENVFCDKTFQVDIETLNDWPNDFELVYREPSFSLDYIPEAAVVDKEVIIPITRDKSEQTTGVNFGTFHGVALTLPENIESTMLEGYKEAINKISHEAEALGVYRPNLEDRKVGKVQMHMVDDGFPNALRHIAEIMTWAEKTKGYKLHDWANLPNADIEFPSAEYRHKNDNSIQKSQGLKALERVDHESGKLHVGHKIFNALCELELILRGVIK